MQIRRRLDSRSKLDDQFVISLDFHELAQLYAGCTQALRSIRTPMPAVESLVDAIEQMAMSEDYATVARLQLACHELVDRAAGPCLSPPSQGGDGGGLDDALGTQEFLDSLPLAKGEPEGVPLPLIKGESEGVPVLLLGPGGQYTREWPRSECGAIAEADVDVHLFLVSEVD